MAFCLAPQNPLQRTSSREHHHAESANLEFPAKKFYLPLIDRGIEIAKLDYWAAFPKNPSTGAIEKPCKQSSQPTFRPSGAWVWDDWRHSRARAAALQLQALGSSREANRQIDDPPYLNDSDTKNGILIADANFSGDDTQRKLNWSELMYQTWALANVTRDGGGPISNLRSVVQREIVYDGTKAAFKLVCEVNFLRPGGDGDADWREWTEVSQASFFYNMLATDDVQGVVYLSKDLAAEMGK
ncbi:MAG: hypothetical protein Q9169_004700 [Polycauliona sp. 2 TL-2023]